MAIVATDNKHYKAIADAIRKNYGIDEKYTPEGMAQGVSVACDARYYKGCAEGEEIGYANGVYEGKMQAYDEFWDEYQNNGRPTSYLYAFAGKRWTDKTYNPKYPIVIDTNALRMYAYSELTDTKVEIDASMLTQNSAYMFEGSKLVTIRKLKWNPNLQMSTSFNECRNLVNIVIEGGIGNEANFQLCPLSRASIENIVGNLKSDATGKTLTLNKAAVEAAFTTEEWETLTATKPNWTFALSA